MKRNQYLAMRLRELFLDGQWIANTNYKDLISDLTVEQATRKVGNVNTIAALVYHINYYLSGLIPVMDGGALEISDQDSFDLPAISTDKEWKAMVDTLLFNAEKFADKVEYMPDEQLDSPFVNVKYGNYYRNIEGVIEHSYYHLGQISLVKKLVLEKDQ